MMALRVISILCLSKPICACPSHTKVGNVLMISNSNMLPFDTVKEHAMNFFLLPATITESIHIEVVGYCGYFQMFCSVLPNWLR